MLPYIGTNPGLRIIVQRCFVGIVIHQARWDQIYFPLRRTRIATECASG